MVDAKGRPTAKELGVAISNTIERAQRDGKTWDQACEHAASVILEAVYGVLDGK